MEEEVSIHDLQKQAIASSLLTARKGLAGLKNLCVNNPNELCSNSVVLKEILPTLGNQKEVIRKESKELYLEFLSHATTQQMGSLVPIFISALDGKSSRTKTSIAEILDTQFNRAGQCDDVFKPLITPLTRAVSDRDADTRASILALLQTMVGFYPEVIPAMEKAGAQSRHVDQIKAAAPARKPSSRPSSLENTASSVTSAGRESTKSSRPATPRAASARPRTKSQSSIGTPRARPPKTAAKSSGPRTLEAVVSVLTAPESQWDKRMDALVALTGLVEKEPAVAVASTVHRIQTEFMKELMTERTTASCSAHNVLRDLCEPLSGEKKFLVFVDTAFPSLLAQTGATKNITRNDALTTLKTLVGAGVIKTSRVPYMTERAPTRVTQSESIRIAIVQLLACFLRDHAARVGKHMPAIAQATNELIHDKAATVREEARDLLAELEASSPTQAQDVFRTLKSTEAEAYSRSLGMSHSAKTVSRDGLAATAHARMTSNLSRSVEIDSDVDDTALEESLPKPKLPRHTPRIPQAMPPKIAQMAPKTAAEEWAEAIDALVGSMDDSPDAMNELVKFTRLDGNWSAAFDRVCAAVAVHISTLRPHVLKALRVLIKTHGMPGDALDSVITELVTVFSAAAAPEKVQVAPLVEDALVAALAATPGNRSSLVLAQLVQTLTGPSAYVAVKYLGKISHRCDAALLRENVVPMVFEDLHAMLSDSHVYLRKAAFYCLIDMYTNVGDDFKGFLRRLDKPQVKLLNLIISQRR
ncbi:CLASP N terminal [Carpediemonas membranifera]|uniref:CLASP N terminal n=1 Tax=Carpediemonas membranifera TaxID=201153 RepID=A0A8J6C0K1_9EUKA|nr:CLASP N terminal [Carpediemonas membranifera]|eukprot:KAG9396666.1 CLASP N terminal [Carpediemonas membranifera]